MTLRVWNNRDQYFDQCCRRAYQLLLVASYLLFSLFIFSQWVGQDRGSFNSDNRCKIIDLVQLKADQPWVFRALVPLTVRAILSPLSSEDKVWLTTKLFQRFPALPITWRYFSWDKNEFLEVVLVLCFDFLSLLGYLVVLRALFSTVVQSSDIVCDFCPLFSLLCLPILFAVGGHNPYDFPNLFLFTAALLFLARQSWHWFYLILALGSLNKETMVLVVLIYALYAWKLLPGFSYGAHLLLQLLVYLAVRLIIHIAVANNPGPLWFPHFELNLQNLWLSPELTDYKITAARLFLLLLVFFRFFEKPRFLRTAVVIAIPLGVTFILSGLWGEIRVFYELMPLVTMLAYLNLCTLIGASIIVKNDYSMVNVSP